MIAFWRTNPLAFVIQCCQADKYGLPVAWQADLLKRFPRTRKEAVASGHGVGKSRIEAWLIWWFIICMKQPGKPLKIPITGPSGGNLEDVIWSEVAVVQKHIHPFFAERFLQQKTDLFCIESERDWFARLRTSRKENPDALQGFHGDPIMFILDEGFGIPDEIYHVARGALSSDHAFALMCGNPTKLSGYAYRVFNHKSRAWHTSQVSCLDNLSNIEQTYNWMDINGRIHDVSVAGRVSPGYPLDVEEESGGKESAQYYIRVLGEFPRAERDQVVKKDWVTKSFQRTERRANDRDLRIMGVDVAWDGEDDSAIAVRNGPIVEELDSWYGNDPTQTAERCRSIFNDYKKVKKPIRWICVDATGIGAGTYSALLAMKDSDGVKLPVLAVKVAETAPEDGGAKCRRIRDWLWWQARLFFKDRRPYLTGSGQIWDKLSEEVTTPGYKYGATGKVEVETKAQLKARKVKSPDVADALCLTFFVDHQANIGRLEVKKRHQHGRKREQPSADRWRTL